MNASVIARSIKRQTKPITQSTNRKEKSTLRTLQKLIQTTCRTLTSSVRAFHAKASAWLAKGSDSGTIQEELSSSKLPESLKRNGLHFFSWKTFPDCYRMTEAGRCLPSSPRLLNWGMISNGVCITARFSESPSSGAACILSDILETNVPESYFLSTAAMRKISSNSFPDRKVSVSTIQAEVPALNAPAPVDGAVKQDCTS